MNTASSTIGVLLREGRLRQRLSIAECAKNTHISPRYLEALEEERWADLPSESHRLGFLRLYSRFLGVSADDMISLYQQGKTAPGCAEKNFAPGCRNRFDCEGSDSPGCRNRIGCEESEPKGCRAT